ncbi:dUTP diphosphatase [Candidatus Pacearchaeota archaeon]|jgi:dUTP pyrophosphatase|nr:dUTP diphosphatase [Candidatus Pacearchaeota archaeon]
MKEVIKVKKISPNAEIPAYAYSTDVGFDLRAITSEKLFPGEQKEFKTGLIFEIPEGHVGLIRDRVGIVTKMGVHTCAGTFDPGFRGEVTIFLVNMSEETQFIEEGMRIAQMVILPVARPEIIEVKKVTDTERGGKSFGSTEIDEIKKLKNSLKKKSVKKKK